MEGNWDERRALALAATQRSTVADTCLGAAGCGHNMINEQPAELRRLIVGIIQARATRTSSGYLAGSTEPPQHFWFSWTLQRKDPLNLEGNKCASSATRHLPTPSKTINIPRVAKS
jgi:hypothetical protein